MSASDPPDLDDLRPVLPPFPNPFKDNPRSPDLPRFLPVARPASLTGIPVASPARVRAWPPTLSAWRAFFEMLALIPMGLAGVVVFYVATRLIGVNDERWANAASTAGMGIAASLAAAFFVWFDRQPAASIGWTGRAFFRQIGAGILTLVGTYAVFFILLSIVMMLFPALQDEEPTAERVVREMMPSMSLRSMIATMLFVALWEEVVFRGFVLTRLHAIVRRWWLAVPLSAVIFGSVHLYEGPMAMVMVTLLGMVLALLFIRRRSLVPCIVMHFLHNSFMMMVMQSGAFHS